MTPVLLAKKLTKTFVTPTQLEILRGIDLSVDSGKSVAITGRSGEGKSTLLHILGTLEKPTSGELLILGQPTDTIPLPKLRNRHLGFIFQSFHLLEESSALENILMPARIARSPQREALERAHFLLEQVDLTDRARFLVKQLSGGEKQRIAIARALFHNPAILFADEPTGSLDLSHAEQVHQILIESTKQMNTSLILVTHNPTLARLCDDHYTLNNGHLCKS